MTPKLYYQFNTHTVCVDEMTSLQANERHADLRRVLEHTGGREVKVQIRVAGVPTILPRFVLAADVTPDAHPRAGSVRQWPEFWRRDVPGKSRIDAAASLG